MVTTVEPVRSWDASEPGARDALVEARRLLRRARSRWLTAIASAALVAAAITAFRAQQQRVFEAEVVFRVIEGGIGAKTAPAANKELRNEVLDVAFAGPRLLAVIREHGLYASKMARDPNAALEAMRDDIEVDVSRNDFLEERTADAAPRTAMVTIAYRAGTPQAAMDVADHLSRLVAESQHGSREATAARAARTAEDAARSIRDDIDARRARLARLEHDMRGPGAGSRMVEAATLRAELASLELRRETADKRRGDLELRELVERAEMGLRFERVDAHAPAPARFSRGTELAIIALATFGSVLPLIALTIGAFDRRVYRSEDLRRVGVPVLGSLPPFAWRITPRSRSAGA